MKFWKYQGAGNDFVMLDQRENQWIGRADTLRIEHLCDRRFGIGADGLILLQNRSGYDFEMVYFNADGRESTMCGNGGRCLAAFAQHLGIAKGECRFMAIDGEHEAIIFKQENRETGEPCLLAGRQENRRTVPIGRQAGEQENVKLEDGLWVELKMTDVQHVEKQGDAYILNTGSPHYVRFVEGLKNLNMVAEGRIVRYSERFKGEGINVNLVEIVKQENRETVPIGRQAGEQENVKILKIRTYERGVEDETYACGTGVAAAAIASFLQSGGSVGDLEIAVSAKGGDLAVRFHANGDGSFSNIWLCGQAMRVFEGEIHFAKLDL